MAATVSASNIKNAMKSAIDAITIDGGEITNDAVLNALANAIANEINATIVAQYLAHKHPAGGTLIDSQAGTVTGTTGGTDSP